MGSVGVITAFLFSVLLGGVIGSAITHNHTALVVTSILLGLDVLIGIISNYIVEQKRQKK